MLTGSTSVDRSDGLLLENSICGYFDNDRQMGGGGGRTEPEGMSIV